MLTRFLISLGVKRPLRLPSLPSSLCQQFGQRR
jgi:hypothetical protein